MKYLYFLTLHLLIPSLIYAGTDSSGGSIGIVNSEAGSVELADFVSKDNEPNLDFDDDFILELYINQHHPMLNQIAYRKKGFFHCVPDKLEKLVQSYPHLQAIYDLLDRQSVLMIEIPITGMSSNTFQRMKSSMNRLDSSALTQLYFTEFDVDFRQGVQMPIAAYNNGILWVSKPIYRHLSQSSECAVQVHEAFRYMAEYGLISRPLSTSEVKALVREVFNQSFDGDDIYLNEANRLFQNGPTRSQQIIEDPSNTEIENLIDAITTPYDKPTDLRELIPFWIKHNRLFWQM